MTKNDSVFAGACPGYRLPTVAEWEYAARAGTRTATYAGDLDDDIPYTCEPNAVVDSIAWYCGNTDSSAWPVYLKVAQKAPNEFGLYEMIGNVGEYCASSAHPLPIHNQPLAVLVGQQEPGPLVDPAPPMDDLTEESQFERQKGASWMFPLCGNRASQNSSFPEARGRVS